MTQRLAIRSKGVSRDQRNSRAKDRYSNDSVFVLLVDKIQRAVNETNLTTKDVLEVVVLLEANK